MPDMADERLIFGLAERHYADMAEIFRRYPQIEQVLIFGSRAKGTDKPWSDFDLAVVAPNLSDRDFSRLWNEIDDLPLVFKLDLLHWDKLGEIPLKEKIVQEGRRFYPLPEKQ
ncbi:nucleotidyltransferase domain-containing protein [Desulfuromonas acetexigens]|jgi:proline iminopeptidase|uniref:Nucleotidyltransferase domain-containing protein n=2 Tax=Trichloromonas acetexigens TaxID=38815 RepID=A0A550JIU9_9BACT|nr:nucleotidyltransferase domain-containing protein [Desulfuromonas acetexigens]